MKLMIIKSNIQILLVPNYSVFRITVIYVKFSFAKITLFIR